MQPQVLPTSGYKNWGNYARADPQTLRFSVPGDHGGPRGTHPPRERGEPKRGEFWPTAAGGGAGRGGLPHCGVLAETHKPGAARQRSSLLEARPTGRLWEWRTARGGAPPCAAVARDTNGPPDTPTPEAARAQLVLPSLGPPSISNVGLEIWGAASLHAAPPLAHVARGPLSPGGIRKPLAPGVTSGLPSGAALLARGQRRGMKARPPRDQGGRKRGPPTPRRAHGDPLTWLGRVSGNEGGCAPCAAPSTALPRTLLSTL